MFTIVKGKGKRYKTEIPEHAILAYMGKHAISLWYNGNVVLTKCSKNMVFSQVQVWDYIDRYCNLKGGE